MKTLIVLVSLLAVGMASASTSVSKKHKKAAAKAKATTAATTTESSTTKMVTAQTAGAAQPSKSGLSTDVRFGDQSVGGKYQLPMEALSVVENEKSIDDLIGVRKNFQDRVERTKGMR